MVHRLRVKNRHTECPRPQNPPWKMSPKEPPPIFFESRYFLPTRSSILAFTNGEATLRCATAACGAAERKVVSQGRKQRIWAPASDVYCHGEPRNSLGFEAHCGAGTTVRAASRPCSAPRAAGRAASTQHRSRGGNPPRSSPLPPVFLSLLIFIIITSRGRYVRIEPARSRRAAELPNCGCPVR